MANIFYVGTGIAPSPSSGNVIVGTHIIRSAGEQVEEVYQAAKKAPQVGADTIALAITTQAAILGLLKAAKEGYLSTMTIHVLVADERQVQKSFAQFGSQHDAEAASSLLRSAGVPDGAIEQKGRDVFVTATVPSSRPRWVTIK